MSQTLPLTSVGRGVRRCGVHVQKCVCGVFVMYVGRGVGVVYVCDVCQQRSMWVCCVHVLYALAGVCGVRL